MDSIYLTLVVLCAAVALFLLIFSALQTPSHEQKILLILSFCLAVLTLGSAVSIGARRPQVAEIGMIFSHYGGVHISFCFLVFLCMFSRIKLHKAISVISVIINTVFVTLMATNSWRGSMFYNIQFEYNGRVMNQIVEFAPGYHLYLGWNTVYLLLMLFVIIKSAVAGRYKSKYMKLALFAFIFAAASSYITLFIPVVAHSKYDYRFLGCTIGSLVMYYTVYKVGIVPMKVALEESIISEIDDIIVSIDSYNRLLYANKKALHVLGLDNDITYGMPIDEVGERLIEISTLEDGETFSFADSTYMCQTKEISQKNDNTITIHWLKDITKEHDHLQETMKLKDEADKANLAKSMFLAHMSHEIRTPINSIIGMDEMILRESNDPDIRSYATDLMRSGKTLISLINDLLEYSKIEAGKTELSLTYYSISGLFREIDSMMRFKADSKSLKLCYDVDPSIPRSLYGDEIRIKQIITNIVDNAIKYTEKGTVTISVNYKRIDDMNLHLLIDIKDTGVGIKEQDVDKLFGSIDSVDKNSSHNSNGVGLGLTITKKLLELMNGTLSVDSLYGVGTNIHISIPQIISDPAELGKFEDTSKEMEKEKEKKVSEEKKKKEAHHVSFTAPDASVLIVDDIKTNRTIAKLLVKNTGIKFEESDSGEKALEMIQAKHYDVILLDQRMPGLTGVETLQKMKEMDHLNKGVPVVALTADAEAGAAEYYISVGFTEYMPKPMDPASYETMLIRLIPHDKIKIVEDSKDSEEKTEKDEKSEETETKDKTE